MSLSWTPSLVSVDIMFTSVENAFAVFSNCSIFCSSSASDSNSVATAPSSSALSVLISPYVTSSGFIASISKNLLTSFFSSATDSCASTSWLFSSNSSNPNSSV